MDAERLRALAPDVILTQDQCEVCAASLADVEAALARWLGSAPRVVSLDPRTLGDVLRDVGRVAAALGAPERGRALQAELSARIADLGERAAGTAGRPRVALRRVDRSADDRGPLDARAARAGGRLAPRSARRGGLPPGRRWDALRAADPDVLVVLPCGFDLARSRAELSPLRAQPGFDALRAVRSGRAYLVDGNQYMNRPGPRLVDSLEILCELLHPEAFAPAHRGEGWEPL